MSNKAAIWQSRHLLGGIMVISILVIGAASLLFFIASNQHAQQGPSSAQLQQALQEIVEPLSLSPFQGVSANPIEVKVKNLPIYCVATGLIAQPEDTARLTVGNDVQRHGWAIRSQGNVDSSLGWEMIAIRDSMVLRVDVGKEAKGVADSPYKAQTGYTYVQASIAGQNSGPEWAIVVH